MTQRFTDTPICDALTALRGDVRANLHALPLSQGRSIVGSRFEDRYRAIFGEQFLGHEQTHTGVSFDSLFNPERCIRLSQQQTAEAFGADTSLYVSGGTTAANFAVVVGLLSKRSRVLIDRTCHQSIHFALAQGVPQQRITYVAMRKSSDGSGRSAIDVADLFTKYRAAFEAKDPYTIVILSGCSYEGVFLDAEHVIRELAAISDNVVVFFDEAWFAFASFDVDYRRFTAMAAARKVRPTAKRLSIVSTQSVHKSLSALRQSSLIHVSGNAQVIENVIRGHYQAHTTSPSYPILASIELARAQAVQEGPTRINQALGLARFLSQTAPDIDGVRINETKELLDDYTLLDPLRVSIDISGLSDEAQQVRHYLFTQFGVHLSRVTKTAILVNVHIGVSSRCIGLLLHGLRSYPQNPVANGFVIPYPPGVPLVVPGDNVTPEVNKEIEELKMKHVVIFDTNGGRFRTSK